MLAAVFIMIAAWFMPYGRLIFYPLSLLGIWFHEMGHALATILVGGKFGGIQIFTNLSGINYSYLPVNSGAAKLAFVSAIGPIMPSIFGSLLIISGRSKLLARYSLILLSVIMIIVAITSTVIYSDGMIIIGLLGIGIGYSTMKLDHEFLRLIVNVLGIEAVISIFSSFNYLTQSTASVGGKENLSDTQLLAQLTGINHLFWAFFITIFSSLIMILAIMFSLGLIFNKNLQKNNQTYL